jgi:hypothetical protein
VKECIVVRVYCDRVYCCEEICLEVFEATIEQYGVRDILNFRCYEDVVSQQRTDKRLEECGTYVKVQSGESKSSPHLRSLS